MNDIQLIEMTDRLMNDGADGCIVQQGEEGVVLPGAGPTSSMHTN